MADGKSSPEESREQSQSKSAESKDTSTSSSKVERRKRRGCEIWLHIYDLDSYTARLNDYVLRPLRSGAFHCGVEALEGEWFFACGDSTFTGVLCNEPKGHQVHVYKESLSMGESPLSRDEINEAIEDAMDAWPANSYHPIHRNCINFAEDLCKRLKVPNEFPAWLHGAPDLGKNVILSPIAEWGWRWVKWYNFDKPQDSPPDNDALEARGSGSTNQDLRKNSGDLRTTV